MKESSRFYCSKLDKMKERGWTVIPWEAGQPNQAEVLDWLRSNGTGEFYYAAGDSGVFNSSIVIKDTIDATLFILKFGVE